MEGGGGLCENHNGILEVNDISRLLAYLYNYTVHAWNVMSYISLVPVKNVHRQQVIIGLLEKLGLMLMFCCIWCIKLHKTVYF